MELVRNFTITITLFASLISCTRDKRQPGYEIFPDMVHSNAYEAYSENPLTPDGKTMMLPPAHSIARGYTPFEYGKSESEAIRAGNEVINPLLRNDKTIAIGKKNYEKACLVCHGVTGQGDGPLIPKFPNPPALTNRSLRVYPDGRLFHVITKGIGDMPSHEVQLTQKERWAVIHYIRQLQEEYGRK